MGISQHDEEDTRQVNCISVKEISEKHKKVAKSRLFWYNVTKYVFMKAETFYEDIGDNHSTRRQ